MTIATHALVFRPSVYNKPSELEGASGTPLRAKIAGAIALVLWFGVVCAGRGIGYIHPPPFSHHFTAMRALPGELSAYNSAKAALSDTRSGALDRRR